MEKKEAMKILKDFHDKSALFSVRTALDTIIPELRESEDEKIKNRLIKLIKMSSEVGGFALHKWEADELLAWLEKQGKETSEKEFTFKALPRLLEMIEVSDRAKAYTEKLAVALDNEGYHTDAKIVRESIKIMNGEEVSMATMDEQKPVDNIEPKFKVGDFIVNDYCFGKVIEITNDAYLLDTGQGIPFSYEHNAHLWTINDAKDGDVLATPNYIYIFNSIDKETETVAFYCLIKKSDKHFSFGDYRIHDEILNSTPATKKQYDILIKAMTDAGYTFNFEKKELKKIKQKSQRMVSAEAKEALYDKPTDEEMKELLRTEYEKGRADTIAEMYVPTQISPEESLGVSSEKYMDIVDTLTQGGQKLAKWSLEDERVIAIINNALTESNTPPDDYDKVYDWLESLKQRIGG